MKVFYSLFFLLFFQVTVNAQRFDGQWRGGFTDNSTSFIGFGGERIDYVLELECSGTSVRGYSYTYFTERARRYYTICRLTGTINKATKEVIVTEVERTKYNTPPDFRNCFQTHKLRYVKDSDSLETLEGTWIPAPNQTGDCGFGKTTLVRRLLKRLPLTTPKKEVATTKKIQPSNDLNKSAKPPLALKQKTPTQNKKPVTQNTHKKSPVIKNNDVVKNDDRIKNDNQVKNNIPIINTPEKKQEKLSAPKTYFEKRTNSVLKTIEIERDTFTVKMYDNGEIDGDSVSVFYNGALVASHQRLSEKPIILKLPLNKSIEVNELTMYAENLGTIPPNTALMVVTDGDKRYEVRISSDNEKNGTLAFTHK
jgi:hypothetical protein